MLSRNFLTVALIFGAFTLSAAAAEPPPIDDALADRGLQALDAKDAALRRAIRRASPSIVADLSPRADRRIRSAVLRSARPPPTAANDLRRRDGTSGGGNGRRDHPRQSGKILTCYHLVRAAVAPGSKYDLNVRTQDGMLYSDRPRRHPRRRSAKRSGGPPDYADRSDELRSREIRRWRFAVRRSDRARARQHLRRRHRRRRRQRVGRSRQQRRSPRRTGVPSFRRRRPATS